MKDSIKGRISSVESFGTVDGPGIRYIVFLQGCPLRCLYCHNRDTWDPKGGKETTVDEVFNEILKYKDYFRFSGGGVTVSGGEPTLQADFVTELFKKCKEHDINTALDTSGFADTEKLQELLSLTDLVLLDIKQTDENKHKQLTGVGLDKIRRFAAYLKEKKIPVWIRYVLVPGYTDDIKDLKEASEFISRHDNVQRVEVLPYHSMGQCKWEELGDDYKLKGIVTPSQEDVDKAQNILSAGLKRD
ncbi:pyruvate formate-lyase-activating protein [Alkalibacter saccharofermentans]|uniref:Pyruvate formate-lyase-activating enzyme n=1 Tax=Alkalibacter saccharofermentans DSM 14828 TaxID=1120975 RepID=A0A1M4SM76_9FIRM|nr:pyruvate formate-lyase-activating protein [Alkalibacter saccharofermentans]SHE33258.1 pyruvate formate lyase activating enzyme [Alkalibacter saccharofermentans DSM 14828]